MRQLYNFLLGVGFCICLYLLVFQGFAAPVLSPLADLLLRFVAASCIQYLTLRGCRQELFRFLPLMLTFLLAVWGIFLFLTSPSWQNATLSSLLADDVTPLLGCCAAWLLYRKLYR